MDEQKEYYETMERFLRDIHNREVIGVCLVAALDKQEEEDFVIHFNISSDSLAQAAGLMLKRAAMAAVKEADDENE